MSSSIPRSTFLTAAAALAGSSLVAPRGGERAMAATGVNIVLVHGASSDGSGWSKVIPSLQAAGHNVVAVQNQMTSLAGDRANTRAAIDAMQGPTVAVGHSYGGAVITAAATDAANVKALVYIAAFAPDEGETVGEIGSKFPPAPGGQYVAPGPGGLLYIDRAHMAAAFAGDLPPAEGAVLAAVQRPVATAIFTDKMGAPAWKQIKSRYQVSEKDHMIPPEAERMMASRAKAQMISLPSSHASLVSHPRQVAQLILMAAS